MRRHHFAPDEDGVCVSCPLPKKHPTHEVDEPLPEKPYAGTSGWSGSQTSRERAEDEDADGTMSERQRAVLAALDRAGAVGMTWREVAEALAMHHGQASGSLSTLHKAGRIARLADERRERCSVYMALDYVAGRATVVQGRAAADPDVVQREEWRVVGMPVRSASGRMTTEESSTTYDRGIAESIQTERGGTVQRRVVIERPWEDA